jgi:serine/threonine protein kinase
MDLLGKTIGEYQLIELIHQGQNTIYKGFQPSTNRYVAVKILKPSLAADPAFVQGFNEDMGRIAGLEHPNVLRIYDYGQQDDLLYIVTRYVETGSLKDRLPPALSPQGAQRMVNPIAEALDYLHGQGVVSGNLKPSNILITEQGQPLLADLGYSQGIDVSERESVYLSPEQAQGTFADQRTDVYALGVLLYEMLVGEPPAPGAAPSPRLKQPDIPVEVEKVILKAMAQYPEQRFQTPGELSRALNLALTPGAAPAAGPPEPTAAPPPQAPPPAARRGPSWVVILLGGLVVLCLLAVCAAVVIGGLGGQPAAPAPTATTAPDQPAPEPTPTPPDGSLIQGLFDMVKSIFDSLASIIDSIFGGGSQPEPTEEPPPEQPPEEQPPEEQPPPEPEQPTEEPAEG